MHFWIDKRSQACGFGRSRVAASLSNSGGNGNGFGHHPPRRLGGSKSQSGPNIHRLNSQDFARPAHLISSSSSNSSNSGSNAARQQQQQHRTRHSNNNNHNSNIHSNNNNNNNSQQQQIYYQHQLAQQQQHQQQLLVQQQQLLAGISPNHHYHYSPNNATNRYSTDAINNIVYNHLQRSNYSQNNNNSNSNSNNTNNSILNNNLNSQTTINNGHHYHNLNNQEISSVPLPHIYGGPPHDPDLEQSAIVSYNVTRQPQHLSSAPITTTTTTTSALQYSNAHINGMIESPESQLLPSHLKCGMWASLVLASVFVAGAKFYFDHQGTGLEVLIFCAFSATFFLAACTVSLCRLPRDLTPSPSPSIDGHSHGLDGSSLNGVQNMGHLHTSSQYHNIEQLHQDNQLLAAATAAPPPYHIAILLPETTKELVELDETPPPSYDKILI